eukprot:4148221-Karenia_brevis.AAC.1
MEPFDEPPTRETEARSSTDREEGAPVVINSVIRVKGFRPRPGNPCGVPMPNFGGRASLKPQVNPFRDPSPAITEERDPS